MYSGLIHKKLNITCFLNQKLNLNLILWFAIHTKFNISRQSFPAFSAKKMEGAGLEKRYVTNIFHNGILSSLFW